MNKFPKGFVWGTATASYQIEGATTEDGRGASIWDTFCKTPSKVKNGDTGEVACDHYHRFDEDIRLMKELGVKSYRFSIAWTRLFPDGDQRREERGFDFYNRLIDALLENDIEPIITAYHWDLPQPLEDAGGWTNRRTAEAFALYMGAVVEAYGGRVNKFLTLNEPWCTAWLGYALGVHAPGIQNFDAAIAAAHHTALAHGLGVRAARRANSDVKIGIALNMSNYRVSEPSDASLIELQGLMESHQNLWWLEAFSTGRYPQNLVESFGDALQRVILPGDMKVIQVATDFVGLNYYCDTFINEPAANDQEISSGRLFPFEIRANLEPPKPLTDIGWPITPVGLKDAVLKISAIRPDLDIFITENGAAYPEGPDATKRVRDVDRIDYLRKHLKSLLDAIAEGAKVKGYYLWSLLDNFEWAEGYDKRFGIIHVDFATQVRTIKDSAYFYAEVIASNGKKLEA